MRNQACAGLRLACAWFKKKRPRTKTGLAEKDVISNGRLRPPSFDRSKSFGHDDLIVKHWYFRCLRPPDVDGIKIFD